MITDIHRHFVPDEFLRFVQAEESFGIKIDRFESDYIDFTIRGGHLRLNSTFFDLAKQAEQMRRDGVERVILSLATPFIDYPLDGKLAAEAARVFNDSLASAISSQRQRLGGWAFLPIQDPGVAAQELRRCVRDHGFIGGHIASNVRGVYLDDAQFEPVFRAAADLGVPLFVHPADPLGKDRTKEYELTIVAGYLFDNTINILKMVCSGFFDRWPSLKLVFAHAGAFSTILRARMQREVETNPGLASALKMPIGHYLRHIYADTICFEPAILRHVANVIPIEHLLLGSDSPFPLREPDPVNFVRNALPAREAEFILNRNFESLIGAA
ncbi:MAG: amidohydrolase family protein [Rhodomicrobium sp.]